MDFRIPDNSGATISDQPIIEGGPAVYFSTLPVTEMLTALLAEGIPTEYSLSTGAYLCNQVFYVMMHEIACKSLPMRAGFIHLPVLPEQAAQSDKGIPSMCFEKVLLAAKTLISHLHQTQPG